MLVPVVLVGRVTMIAVHVIKVIAMRHRFVAATVAVCVIGVVLGLDVSSLLTLVTMVAVGPVGVAVMQVRCGQPAK